MKKHLWFLAGLFVLFASCFGSGGGGGGGDPGISEGPKTSYLLYSAFDGTDWELHLLNPEPFETLQLTNNDTADIMPASLGTKLIWQCDDGAGSEGCLMDMLEKKFTQLTTIAGGGELGRTINSKSFSRASGSNFVMTETSPRGRMYDQNSGIMRYNAADKSLVIKSFGEITGVTDEFSGQYIGRSFLTKTGNMFFEVNFSKSDGGDRPNYSTEQGQYMMDPAGEIKKMDSASYVLWNYKGSVIGMKYGENENSFGVVDQTTAQFSPVRSFRVNEEMGYCRRDPSSLSIDGMLVFPVSPAYRIMDDGDFFQETQTPTYKLYMYDDSAKELKLLKDIPMASGDNHACYQNADGTKVLVIISPENGGDIYKVINTDTGEETEVHRAKRDESFIATSDDLSTVALMGEVHEVYDDFLVVGKKLIFIDVASKAKTEVEVPVRRGDFTKDGKKFVFEPAPEVSSGSATTVSGNASVYDLEQKKLTALPMPLYPKYHIDLTGQGNFILLRRQNCTVDRCSLYDNHATASFKLYNVSADKAFDVPTNGGKDILFPVWIELTPAEYAKWKLAAADAEFIKSARPSADAGGPFLYVYPKFNNTLPVLDYSILASAYSRQASPNFTWAKIIEGVESPAELTRPDFPGEGILGEEDVVLDLWKTFSEVGMGYGTPAAGKGSLIVKVSDGTSTAEEKIGYYMLSPGEDPCVDGYWVCPPTPCEMDGGCPPENSHLPVISSVTTTAGVPVTAGSSWVCSLSESTGSPGDIAAAKVHNAAVFGRMVALKSDEVAQFILDIETVDSVAVDISNSLLGVSETIMTLATGVYNSVALADNAIAAAISSSATAEQIANAEALVVTIKNATWNLIIAIGQASTPALNAAIATEDTDIDANAKRIIAAAAYVAAEFTVSSNNGFLVDRSVTNLLPGCAVRVTATDTGNDIRNLQRWQGWAGAPIVDLFDWNVSEPNDVHFTVTRPPDGTRLPEIMGAPQITVIDEQGDRSEPFTLNLSVTY